MPMKRWMAAALLLLPTLAMAEERERPWFFAGGPTAEIGWRVPLPQNPVVVDDFATGDFGVRVQLGRHFGRTPTGFGAAVELQSTLESNIGVGGHLRWDLPVRRSERLLLSVAPVVGGGVGYGSIESAWSDTCEIYHDEYWDLHWSCHNTVSPWSARAFAGPELVWQLSRLRFSVSVPMEVRFSGGSTTYSVGPSGGIGLAF